MRGEGTDAFEADRNGNSDSERSIFGSDLRAEAAYVVDRRRGREAAPAKLKTGARRLRPVGCNTVSQWRRPGPLRHRSLPNSGATPGGDLEQKPADRCLQIAQ